MGRAAVLPHNYPHLQNLIKRDAASYVQEFTQQYQHFKASLAIVSLRPAAADDHFEALVSFISHVRVRINRV
jgi:protein SDA1